MRDKLSEIIQSAVGGCAKYWADVIADKLIAEGVIVPPCKVGDTVYCIWQYSDFAKTELPFIKEAKVCSFVIDEGFATKNGRRIWENDIVSSSEYKDLYFVFYGKHNISCCGCCYSSHQSVGFYISDTEDGLTSAEENEWEKWEVIGNRFDNTQ